LWSIANTNSKLFYKYFDSSHNGKEWNSLVHLLTNAFSCLGTDLVIPEQGYHLNDLVEQFQETLLWIFQSSHDWHYQAQHLYKWVMVLRAACCQAWDKPPKLKTATEKDWVANVDTGNSLDLNSMYNPILMKAPSQLVHMKIHPFFKKVANATKHAPQPALAALSSTLGTNARSGSEVPPPAVEPVCTQVRRNRGPGQPVREDHDTSSTK
jgi:hypothetical protein